MYKVFFAKDSSKYILNYFEKYRIYYENLFQDSWIWSENQIIKLYIDDALNRHNELKDLIVKTLKEEKVFWRTNENSLVITWRTKSIFLDFDENLDLKQRYVINISIR